MENSLLIIFGEIWVLTCTSIVQDSGPILEQLKKIHKNICICIFKKPWAIIALCIF